MIPLILTNIRSLSSLTRTILGKFAIFLSVDH